MFTRTKSKNLCKTYARVISLSYYKVSFIVSLIKNRSIFKSKSNSGVTGVENKLNCTRNIPVLTAFKAN